MSGKYWEVFQASWTQKLTSSAGKEVDESGGTDQFRPYVCKLGQKLSFNVIHTSTMHWVLAIGRSRSSYISAGECRKTYNIYILFWSGNYFKFVVRIHWIKLIKAGCSRKFLRDHFLQPSLNISSIPTFFTTAVTRLLCRLSHWQTLQPYVYPVYIQVRQQKEDKSDLEYCWSANCVADSFLLQRKSLCLSKIILEVDMLGVKHSDENLTKAVF